MQEHSNVVDQVQRIQHGAERLLISCSGTETDNAQILEGNTQFPPLDATIINPGPQSASEQELNAKRAYLFIISRAVFPRLKEDGGSMLSDPTTVPESDDAMDTLRRSSTAT